MKKKIIHIIDSLKTGGAEKLLIGILDSLNDYDNIIITLNNENDFIVNNEIICIDYNTKFDLFRCVKLLKTIIKQYHPDIIHSHLLTSSLLARLSINEKQKLIFSIHNYLSIGVFKKNKLAYILEKIFYRKNQTAIFVSNEVKKDYAKSIGIKGRHYVLPNYIDDIFYYHSNKIKNLTEYLRFVSVGTLKAQKNHQLLIETFSKYKNKFSIDIIGDGPLLAFLQNRIKSAKAENIRLLGSSNQVQNDLNNYDVFIIASHYEGFGIALVEAMAKGLPCIASDIPVFREVGANACMFFKPNDNSSLERLLDSIINGEIDLAYYAKEGRKRAFNFSKEKYLEKLISVYENTINE